MELQDLFSLSCVSYATLTIFGVLSGVMIALKDQLATAHACPKSAGTCTGSSPNSCYFLGTRSATFQFAMWAVHNCWHLLWSSAGEAPLILRMPWVYPLSTALLSLMRTKSCPFQCPPIFRLLSSCTADLSMAPFAERIV